MTKHTFRQEHAACAACGWSGKVFAWSYESPKCGGCGQPAARVVAEPIGQAPAVVPDDIPGGLEVKHAICNPDGSPKKYYSKSEIRAEAARRGYTILGETPGAMENRWV